MSERWRGDGEELDLATVTHDDLLLDALGQGTDQPDGDDLGVMLAAWRDDLGAGVDEDAARTPDGDPLLDRLGAGVLPPAAPVVPAAPAPVRQRAVRRRVLRLAAAAVAAVVLTTGLGIGSREAGPSHPLWSLTKVLHPERAQVRVVEDTIDRAREAIAAGRFDEAAQLLDQARRDLARVGDPAEADRLRAEIDAVQRELSAPGCPGWPRCEPSVPSSPPQAPSAGVPGGSASPAPRATAGKPPAASSPSPAPSPSSGRGLVPRLPGLPLPTASGPSALPSLPGLPLPTVDLPG